MNFVQATKIYNDQRKLTHPGNYCVPRKGTVDYFAVIKIMEENKKKPKYTNASNTLKAVLARKKAPPIPKTNLLDLKPDALDIIGKFVKKDNLKAFEKEQERLNEKLNRYKDVFNTRKPMSHSDLAEDFLYFTVDEDDLKTKKERKASLDENKSYDLYISEVKVFFDRERKHSKKSPLMLKFIDEEYNNHYKVTKADFYKEHNA